MKYLLILLLLQTGCFSGCFNGKISKKDKKIIDNFYYGIDDKVNNLVFTPRELYAVKHVVNYWYEYTMKDLIYQYKHDKTLSNSDKSKAVSYAFIIILKRKLNINEASNIDLNTIKHEPKVIEKLKKILISGTIGNWAFEYIHNNDINNVGGALYNHILNLK